jgi:hypothetical protein
MPIVAVTRTRMAHLRFVPPFARDSLRVALHARRAPGFVTGALRIASGPEFWTMTVWEDGRAMHRFVSGGVHAEVMPRMAKWAAEASMSGWPTDEWALPTWAEAQRRLEAAPRFARLDETIGEVVRAAPRRSAGVRLPAAPASKAMTGASRR